MEIKIDTLGVEFTFDARISEDRKRVKFYKELYGYKTNPYGKYTYIKDGFLSNIKHLKPTRSTIIVSLKDAKGLRSFFKIYSVVFDEKIVILKEREARKLGLRFPSGWRRVYEELKGNENLKISFDI